MHRAAYSELGLEGWTYEGHEVGENELETYLDGLSGRWRGLSLTMPLKRVATRLVDDLSPHALSVRAVNTIIFEDGRRYGDNTDIPGLIAALEERSVREVGSAVIVGAGATAASAAAALRLSGLRTATLLVREPARASGLARLMRGWGIEVAIAGLDDTPPDGTELLVSTVPSAGVDGHAERWCEHVPAVFDVSYDPWPTPLAEHAERAGLSVVTGLDLLAHQGALQVEAMTGEPIDPAVLRDAASAELSTR